jgi:hypothetical protein
VQPNFSELLLKEMTRREFLAALGVGLVSVMGFASILKFFEHKKTQPAQKYSHGYGNSAYGR